MASILSRRGFNSLLAASVAAAASSGLVGNVAAAGTPRIRRNITDPSHGADATAKYRQAVGLLKAKPASDALNWLNLANIHVQHCPHQNWYFLPWHRAYLNAFEEICREVLGDDQFALPYWNWTSFRQLPPGFVNALDGGSSNALYHDARFMKGNATLSQAMLAQFGIDEVEQTFGDGHIKSILQAGSFQTFGSTKPRNQNSLDPQQWQKAVGVEDELESGPHDFLHGTVGGDMGAVPTSAKDPIFYLHHCNLDRLWAAWNRNGGKNDPDHLWQDFVFQQNFVDRKGKPAMDLKVADLQSTEQLGYVYDDDEAQIEALVTSISPFEKNAFPPTKWGDPLALNKVSAIAVDQPPALQKQMQVTLTEPERQGRVYLILNGVTSPTLKTTNVRIFLNCDYLIPQTPADDPHRVASFTFFDHSMDGMAMRSGTSLAFDITDTARKVTALGKRLDQQLLVQLVPVTAEAHSAAGDFSVDSVEVALI